MKKELDIVTFLKKIRRFEALELSLQRSADIDIKIETKSAAVLKVEDDDIIPPNIIQNNLLPPTASPVPVKIENLTGDSNLNTNAIAFNL